MLTFTYNRNDVRPAILISICTVLATLLTLQCLAAVVGGLDLSWVAAIR